MLHNIYMYFTPFSVRGWQRQQSYDCLLHVSSTCISAFRYASRIRIPLTWPFFRSSSIWSSHNQIESMYLLISLLAIRNKVNRKEMKRPLAVLIFREHSVLQRAFLSLFYSLEMLVTLTSWSSASVSKQTRLAASHNASISANSSCRDLPSRTLLSALASISTKKNLQRPFIAMLNVDNPTCNWFLIPIES